MPRIRDLAAEQAYDLSAVLPGPLQDVGEGKRYAHRLDATREHLRAIRDGKDYALWAEYQRRYGGDGAGLATNLVLPRIMVASPLDPLLPHTPTTVQSKLTRRFCGTVLEIIYWVDRIMFERAG